MFSLGASCVAPADRHLTPLPPGLCQAIDTHRATGRVLVLGGATTPLVELLLRRGDDVTVAEPTRWAQCARDLWPATEIAAFDSWDALDDFARHWFSTVLLLGGIIELGGPWWTESSDAWADRRPEILRSLPELVARDGLILADCASSSDNSTLTYTAQGSSNGHTSMTFATIIGDGRSVMLTTHSYFNGVEESATLHTVGRVPWGGEPADGVGARAVTEGIWSIAQPHRALV
jgi:hypothetical protein